MKNHANTITDIGSDEVISPGSGMPLSRWGRQVLSQHVFIHRYAPRVHSQATGLYCILWTYADEQEPPTCFPKRKTLARHMNLKKEDSVDQYLDELKAIGAIEVRERRSPDGGQTSNLYVLKPLHYQYDSVQEERKGARQTEASRAPDVSTPKERKGSVPTERVPPSPQKGDKVNPVISVQENSSQDVLYATTTDGQSTVNRIPIPGDLVLEGAMRTIATGLGLPEGQLERVFQTYTTFYKSKPYIVDTVPAWTGSRWDRWVQKRLSYVADMAKGSPESRSPDEDEKMPIPADLRMSAAMREMALSLGLDGFQADKEFRNYLRKHRKDDRFSHVCRTREAWEGSGWQKWLMNSHIVKQHRAEAARRLEAERMEEERYRQWQAENPQFSPVRELELEDRYGLGLAFDVSVNDGTAPK